MIPTPHCHPPEKTLINWIKCGKEISDWLRLKKQSEEKRLRDCDLLSLKKRWLQEEPRAASQYL